MMLEMCLKKMAPHLALQGQWASWWSFRILPPIMNLLDKSVKRGM